MAFKNQNTFPLALAFEDVLLLPQYSEVNSRSEIDLTTKISDKVTLKIPLIATNMDTITGVDMAVAMGNLGGLAVFPRFEAPENEAEKVKKAKEAGVLVAASVGVKEGFMERAEMLVSAGADIIDVDAAHGHLKKVLDAISALKKRFGNEITLITGIVATEDTAEEHFKRGSDCVTVGVGGGSICTTRIQTGCGVPTFASLLDVSKIAKKYKKTFMPVAGVDNSGNIVKSLATGACAVRGGNLFAGTDEAPPEIMEFNGKKYKEYSGSTSKKQKQQQMQRYSNGKTKQYTVQIEGTEGMVEYKGSLENTVNEILAGVKSGLSYCGANNIKELQEKAQFIQITSAGIHENGAHDIFEVK